ncbi:MAG: hypothetical protein A3J76_02100 [Candidatus Moranbacteria bacterium RBG_13_45_13]|nr:MAG: hypothetical protein A3J76_02100 [Candidatus Moranbacteria bacterium RBG_13_45_13]
MSIEQRENNLSVNVIVGELKKMNAEQLGVWIKKLRDNQLLIKVRDQLQAEILQLQQGEERKELGEKLSVINYRIKENRNIERVGRYRSTSGLQGTKNEYNV